jgi:uncharacterized protein YeaO (DUF488 family)
MALEASVDNLVNRLHELGEAIAMFQWAAVEDRPRQGDSVLIDIVGAVADDLLGLAHEAGASAAEGRKALSPSADLDRFRRQLTACQERFNELSQRFTRELSTYERIAELKQIGRERRGAWLPWSAEVTRSIERVQDPLHQVNEGLFLCWREIAERAGTMAVSVQTNTIGQRITVATDHIHARKRSRE